MKNAVNGPAWEPAKEYVVDNETVKSVSASAIFAVDAKDKTKSFAIDNSAMNDVIQLVEDKSETELLDNYNLIDANYRVGVYFAEGYLANPDTTKGGIAKKTSINCHLED